MFIRLLVISVIIIFISLLFLGLRILLKNGGRFPQIQVGRNREMRKRGIKCAQETDLGCNQPDATGNCSTCGSRLRAEG